MRELTEAVYQIVINVLWTIYAGYPDMATRALVSKLSHKFPVRIDTSVNCPADCVAWLLLDSLLLLSDCLFQKCQGRVCAASVATPTLCNTTK